MEIKSKIFDAHLHIIDPRFPLIPNQGYLPEPFTCRDYLDRLAGYPLAGGAVVSGSFQGVCSGSSLEKAHLMENNSPFY